MLQLIPVLEARDFGWTDPETGIAGLYQVNRLSRSELLVAIDDHLEPLTAAEQTVDESCPFFGGVIVVVDGCPRLPPQCCGDLSDINDWFRVGEDTFSEAYICKEGHPIPHVTRQGETLTVVCRDEWEEFAVGTEPQFVIQRGELLEALASLRAELERFCSTIDELSGQYGVPQLSRILVALESGA